LNSATCPDRESACARIGRFVTGLDAPRFSFQHPPRDMARPSETVFVYGTLRRGASNHFRMAGAEFVAAATARGRLYRIDWYPGFVPDGGAGPVAGEVYRVFPELLRALDDFEGGEYHRLRLEVSCLEVGMPPLDAWIWVWAGAVCDSRLLPHGDWLAEPR